MSTDPAKIHAPKTQAEFLAAALTMRAGGLYCSDIARALKLTRNEVLQLLHAHDQAVKDNASLRAPIGENLEVKP